MTEHAQVRTIHRTILLSAAVAMWVCASSTPAHAQSFTVAWTNERLTIAAADAPLAEVLTDVVRQTGARVIGLEKVSGSVTVDVREERLLDALRTLLAGVGYIIMQWPSASTAADDPVHVWLGKPSTLAPTASLCVATPTDAGPGRRTRCDDGTPGEAAAVTIAADRFPSGPRPAQTEAARLEAAGFFYPNAPEGSLLTAAKAADADVRIRALQTLALQNTKAGVQALNDALNDANPFVRAEALDMLVSLGGPAPEAARRLSDLLEHKDPAVRFPAAMALGEQSGAEAEFQLQRALYHDDGAVRDMAAQLLQQKEKQKEDKDPQNGR